MSGRLPQTATKLLPKVPRLGNPPSYLGFIKTVLADTANKKALTIHGKRAIDVEYERLIIEKVGLQEAHKYCLETKSPFTLSIWRRFELHHHIEDKSTRENALSAVATTGLTLPPVPLHHKNNGRDSWRLQTYKDFAKKAEKLNSSLEFSKELMYNAFQADVDKSIAMNVSPSDRKEIARCLGRESEQYWKGREEN